MCGFFITNDPRVMQKDYDLIESTLKFRGPDFSSELIESNGWKAYHARLTIIDNDTESNQPVVNKDGSILVFNGEILNYKQLGRKYYNKDYNSDTLLLNDLIENQDLSLNELDGFFSFVYINSHGELEYAVRDQFGVKPLFVYENDGCLSFSSEPNTLRKLFNLRVNKDSLEEYKAARSAIFSGSFYHDLVSIDAGTCFINGRYFDCLKFLNGKYKKVEEGELKEALINSIETRKVSDVPIGLLLSRGVDSNLLKSLGEIENYYSIGFKGDEDFEYLKKKDIKGLTLFECDYSQYKKDFEYLLNLRGEPMSVPNEVLLYRIARCAAKDGVKVLLSGEGADEFFGGYDRIYTWAKNSEFDLDQFLQLYCYIPPKKDSEIYNKFASIFSSNNFPSCFEAVRWFFVRYHLPILFRRLDFSLMAAGIEGREPIANMHTFTKAISMSPETLMSDGLGKIPLRDISAEYMGKDFAFEKKVGFPVDLTKIFNNAEGLTSYELWFEENIKVLK